MPDFFSNLVYFDNFEECHDGTYGPECENMCHCKNGIPCNKTTGRCPDGACEAGWEPDQCSQRKL